MTTYLTCKALMQKKQTTLGPNDTISKAFQIMREKGMRFLTVVDEDNKYLGVFTSPTLISLMLPKAITLQMDSCHFNNLLHDISFLSMKAADFHDSLDAVKDEPVVNYLSDPKDIPVVAPDTPIMEGILLLHQYKCHVILVEPDSQQFVGVLSVNSSLRYVFDDNHNF